MRDLLRNYNFTEDPVEQLDARVTLLSNPKLTTGELALAVEELRLAGYQASLNQVEPLGAYVTKGDPRETGPEPTERRPVRPPEKGRPRARSRWRLLTPASAPRPGGPLARRDHT